MNTEDTTAVEVLVRAFERADWMQQRACTNVPSEWFFPGRGEDTARAKAVCADCPVRIECLEYAVRNGEKYGIWGGTSERERRAIRKQRGIRFGNNGRRIAECGTNAGYMRHRSRKEPSCAACLEAHSAYGQATKAARLARRAA